MGWVIKDFECPTCGITEHLVDCTISTMVCCGTTAHALISAPLVVGADSFNPHFDITQGQYFESAEHKRAWLKRKDKEQVEGNLSPRNDGGGRVRCSKTQAQQFRSKRLKDADIPGLKTNPRIQVAVP